MAMEWLIGSFDHFLVLGHNFYFYQRESDKKWLIIEYDYDNTFGCGLQFPMYWNNRKPVANQNNQNNQNIQNNQNNQGNQQWN
jgi:spore coat protein CotH